MIKRILAIYILFLSSSFAQQDITNRYMLGQSYEQAGDFEKARQIYEEIYKQNPSSYQFFDALNRVYIQLKEYESSIKIIGERLKLNDMDINLHGLLGKTYYLKGDEQKAFDVWDNVLRKYPGNPIHFRTIANYAIERRAFDKAVEYLSKGKAASNDPRTFSYDLANIYALTMRFKEAAREYCSILKAEPNQYQLVESKILSYINKQDALEATVNIVKEYSSSDVVGFKYLLSRLYMEQKEFEKAFGLYIEIDKIQNNQGADLHNFASFAYKEKHFELAARAYNEVINRYPNSPFVSSSRLGYAKTLEEALHNEFYSNDNSWKPFYTVKPTDSKNIEKVVTAYNELIQMYPRSEIATEALYRIGRIYLYKMDDLPSAENYFKKIINEFPLSKFIFDAHLELANIMILKGHPDSAAENLLKITGSSWADEDKKNLARYKLAKVEFYQGNLNPAKEHLVPILNNLKDNIANDAIELSFMLNTAINDSAGLVLFAKGEMLAAQRKFTEASEIYRQVSQNGKGFVLPHLGRLREAEMLLAGGYYKEAVELLSEISAEDSKNIYADKALYLLARIYRFGLNDDAKAVEMYEKLLAKFPNSLYLDEAREEIILIRNKAS
jgi:tetratricopeptide (TPR) repeat protein